MRFRKCSEMRGFPRFAPAHSTYSPVKGTDKFQTLFHSLFAVALSRELPKCPETRASSAYKWKNVRVSDRRCERPSSFTVTTQAS